MPNNFVIDISHHNGGPLDFVAARNAGVVGVIAKATQGSGFKDPAYSARKTAALNAGLLWGAYHFGTGADVDLQLSNFLGKTGIDDAMLYALDFEANPGNTMSLAQAKDFIRETRRQARAQGCHLWRRSAEDRARRHAAMPSSASTASGGRNTTSQRISRRRGASSGSGNSPTATTVRRRMR